MAIFTLITVMLGAELRVVSNRIDVARNHKACPRVYQLNETGAGTVISPDLPLRRVALYARTATDIRTPNSVETQLATCRAYAQRQGWAIEMELSDKFLAGQSDDRPGFQDLCRAVESGAVDIVLFVSLDRLSRDLGLVRLLQRTATRMNVELHQVDYGKAQLLDLALLSAGDFKKLALRRAARMEEGARNTATAPSR